MSHQDSCRSTSKCDEPAPSVRSCILLLHRNHRAPSNLCHSEPSSFWYLTLIKLKHASLQELRNQIKSTIESNKVAPYKSTHQGRAPPWQHRLECSHYALCR